jgi:hypothetical protein
MMFKYLISVLLVLLFSYFVSAQQNPQIPGINQKNEATKIEKYVDLFDYRTIKDSVSENGFVLERRFKTLPATGDKPESAVLKKNSKTVFQFDRIVHPFSSVFFGAFPFLGKAGGSQLFIAQIAPRSGNHWVINVKPAYEVLFSSDEYNVGREEFHAIDLDGDRIYELSFESLAFYNFEPQRLGNAGVPLTEIVFKYDAGSRKYVPANPQFANYALRGVDDEIVRIRGDNKDFQLAGVLSIVLQYVYSGREADAWALFDQNYQFADREEIKIKAQAVLKNDAVYQYIYKQN